MKGPAKIAESRPCTVSLSVNPHYTFLNFNPFELPLAHKNACFCTMQMFPLTYQCYRPFHDFSIMMEMLTSAFVEQKLEPQDLIACHLIMS